MVPRVLGVVPRVLGVVPRVLGVVPRVLGGAAQRLHPGNPDTPKMVFMALLVLCRCDRKFQ